MGTPFLGEIKLVAFNFAPKGWAMCNGQFLPINQNQALFSLFGTMYGGNGQTTFALPDLRGRVPIHQGAQVVGEAAGKATHTLTMQEMPTHIHALNASETTGNASEPNFGGTGRVLARDPGNPYASPASLAATNPGSVTSFGGSQAHNNMQPFLTLMFCVALQGAFPSQN